MTSGSPFLERLPRAILAPLPLPFLQPVLGYAVSRTARKRPEFFSRIGLHKSKTFLIDPVNMPFVFYLRPDPDSLMLQARRRSCTLPFDARIAGTFLTLLDMIDGRLDGDALFFSRDLTVEGDTEAVVVLRNALDDLDGRIVDDIAAAFGPAGAVAMRIIRKTRGRHG